MLDAYHNGIGCLPIMYIFIKYELTNMLFINNYIILLIMREWFCWDALWKVKALMKRRSFWWKEKMSFKDKCFWSFCCSLKIKFLTKVQVYVNIKMLSFVTMKVIIFYEKKFMKKSFVILWNVSNLRQSYQLSDLSQNDYFAIRIYIYIWF